MSIFVTIHTRYKDVQFGLFNKEHLIDSIADESKKISKNFIPLLRTLLQRNSFSLSDITFIAAHQGPAPFTTLRVSLASINGLAFATHIPLVGINGLEVFLDEQPKEHTTIALLNAFCKEVYYGIYDPVGTTISLGYGLAEKVILIQAELYTDTVTIIGNGAELYHALITTHFGKRAIIPYPLPEIASLEAVGKAGYKKWKEKADTRAQLMPVYMKEYTTTPSS